VLDTGVVIGPHGAGADTHTSLCVVALDEGVDGDEAVPAALRERLGIHLDFDTWPPPHEMRIEDDGRGDHEASRLGQPLQNLFAETVVRVCLVVAVVGVIATVALPGATVRSSSLLGVLAVVTLGGGAWAVQRGRATWRMPGGLYPILALLGTWFTGFGLEGCSRVGSWWWGSPRLPRSRCGAKVSR